jgi:hypothetical protein
VIAAVVAAVGTLLAAIYARHIDRQRAHEQARLAQMPPIYEDLIHTFLQLGGLPGSRKPQEADLVKAFTMFTEKLIVWGSEAAMLQWLAWRQLSLAQAQGSNVPPERHLEEWERFLFTMRRDLGHRDKNLVPGSLLRLFIKGLP